MSNGAAAQITKEFDLDPNLLPAGASAKVIVSATKDPAVLDAILTDKPFPPGAIELGAIALQAGTGNKLQFKAGDATVGFTGSAEAGAGMGVYADSTRAIAALKLPSAPELDLSLPSAGGDRYLVMDWNYSASGSISLSHPIGALGTVSASISGSRSGIYGVIHALSPDTGSHKAIADTISSWRLPRHVGEDTDLKLKPRTWLLAEADGTLAVKIAAQVGYDFNFAKNFQFLNLTREISAKIDAGLKATFGFSATGNYLVMLGREGSDDADHKVRLRLFKQATRETDFGVDLTIGVTTKSDFPTTINDLVQAIFGVHGQQIVKDLEVLEQWTDPTKDLGDTIARLINSTGLNLLTKTTGIDARTAFNDAKSSLLGVIQRWNDLPGRVSATLWKLIGGLGAQEAADFKAALQLLANPDSEQARSTLGDLIGKAAFADSPISRWLAAVADKGLIALAADLPEVQMLARQTLDFLNGGIIKRLQDFIADRLDLNKLLAAATQADFDKLDGWLIKRLSDFFDENIQFSNLRPIQVAIHSTLTTAENIYGKAVGVLNGNYKFQFAAAATNTTRSTALLDVTFDLLQPGVQPVLKSVLSDSNLDDLLTRQVTGITLGQASLSHSIDRSSMAQVHMPMFDFEGTNVTESVARLTARDEGGRVLIADLQASNTAQVKARYHSQLSALANLRADAAGNLQLDVDDDSVITYDDRQVYPNINFDLLRSRTNAFAKTYLTSVIGSDQGAFYDALQRDIAASAGSSASLGDCLISMQLSYPARILNAWFQPRTSSDLAGVTRSLSTNLQAAYRDLLCAYYFRDLTRLKALDAAAPLLAWASLPITTSVNLDFDGNLHFHDDDNKVYWDFQDRDLRRAMIASGQTTAALQDRMRTAQSMLLAAGNQGLANRYDPAAAQNFQRSAANFGDNNVFFLLRSESEIVNGAANALRDLLDVLPELRQEPSKAIRRLAEFGADFTETFNQNLASVYGDESLRTLGTVLLIEASKILDPSATPPIPDAMLSMALLKPGHKFDAATYIDGQNPPEAETAYGKSIPALRAKAALAAG